MSDGPDMLDELPTPLQLVNDMDRILFYGKRGTRTIHELRVAYVKAKEAYSKAHKQTKLEATGTQADRDDKAQLANWDLYLAMNEAELALQYAKEKKADLQDELSKTQTTAGLVKKEMELAGRS